jgi:hypothetical protein
MMNQSEIEMNKQFKFIRCLTIIMAVWLLMAASLNSGDAQSNDLPVLPATSMVMVRPTWR